MCIECGLASVFRFWHRQYNSQPHNSKLFITLCWYRKTNNFFWHRQQKKGVFCYCYSTNALNNSDSISKARNTIICNHNSFSVLYLHALIVRLLSLLIQYLINSSNTKHSICLCMNIMLNSTWHHWQAIRTKLFSFAFKSIYCRQKWFCLFSSSKIIIGYFLFEHIVFPWPFSVFILFAALHLSVARNSCAFHVCIYCDKLRPNDTINTTKRQSTISYVVFIRRTFNETREEDFFLPRNL